jgi:WS/DGAT/MGAT family acyltransferase
MSSQEIAGERLAELRGWGRQRELGELDALMWRTERHPANSWTGVVVMLLDRAPDWARLQRAHRWFIRLVPRFAERVVEPVLPVGPACWAPDPTFDLDYHLRRVRLPEPGTTRQLLDLAQRLALTPQDRSRPPWVGTVVEGLEDGRAAYLLQAHHVLMDGMAVTQLLSRILAPERDEPTPSGVEAVDELEPIAPFGVTGRALVKQAEAAPRLLRGAARAATTAVRHPARAARYAGSLGRVLAPPPPNPSELLRGGRRRRWRFGTFECELTDLRAAGRVIGGTVNDTFVCALLGGLRRYCAAFGEDLGDIPISMPVSMRKLDEAMGGNKFAGAFFAAPSGIADPAQRIREMRRRVEAVRGEPALDFLGNLTPLLNRTPAPLAASLLSSINSRAVLTTSSWPGLAEERFVSGARFERMFVLAPLPGTSLTGAMCTHVGTCCIGVNADDEVFRKPELLWECIQRGLDEVLALGRPGSNGHGNRSGASAGAGAAKSVSAARKASPASSIG